MWQAEIDLAEACYGLTRDFPCEEALGLTSQIRRAASSVPANSAEGYGRDGRRKFIHFLRISQGSLKELESHLLLAHRVGLISREATNPILCQTDELGKMLRRLYRTLEQKGRQ